MGCIHKLHVYFWCVEYMFVHNLHHDKFKVYRKMFNFLADMEHNSMAVMIHIHLHSYIII